MTDAPLVSIVMPSLDQGRFIGDAVRSVLAQDHPRIELIVRDGGSRDETLDVLERYRREGRLTYTSGPDGGQAAAINAGIARARGDILTWLNSDDAYVTTDAVSAVVRAFRERPEVDLVYGDFVEIDEHNVVQRLFRRPRRFSRARLLRIGFVSQPTTFFRRRVTDALPLDPTLRYAMDLDYWLRASAAGFRFAHVGRVIAAERLHGAAKGVGESRQQRAEARRVRERDGHRFGLRHHLLRAGDKIVFAAYGVAGLWPLLRAFPPAGRPPRAGARLAVPLRRPPLLRASLYQLRLARDGRGATA